MATKKYAFSGNVVLAKSKETGARPQLSEKGLRRLLAEALLKDNISCVRVEARSFKTGSSGFYLWGRLKTTDEGAGGA